MRSPNVAARLAAILLTILGVPLAPSAQIYWTDFRGFNYEGGISFADTDTFAVETLIETGLGNPYRIALDPPGGKMYWVSGMDAAVQRANLDGSNIETVIVGGSAPIGLAVDAEDRKVYWSALGSLYRADLDGSQQELLFAGGGLIQDIALDLVNDKVYFSDWFGGNWRGTLRRANLDGSAPQEVVTGISDGPVGVGVDAAGGKVYWARFKFQTGFGSVQRANLNGFGVEHIVSNVDADSLALDLDAGKVYFSHFSDDYTQAWISRAELNGSNFETLPLGDIVPGGIAFIPEPGAAMLLLAGCVAALRRRR